MINFSSFYDILQLHVTWFEIYTYIFDLAAHLFPLWRFCVNIYTLILSDPTKKEMSSVCESSSLLSSTSSVSVNKYCSTYNYEHYFLVYFKSSLNLLDFHQFLQFFSIYSEKKLCERIVWITKGNRKRLLLCAFIPQNIEFFLRSVHCVKHIKCVFSFLFPFSCPNFPIDYIVIPQTSHSNKIEKKCSLLFRPDGSIYKAPYN